MLSCFDYGAFLENEAAFSYWRKRANEDGSEKELERTRV